MKKPIFVIGKHRSGTTGLANHICEHPSVSGVQHKQHWGIHESGYFTYLAGRYGSLQSWPNFREFVEVFVASDYFKLTGLSKDYALSLFPTSYCGFFRSIMDEFARHQGVPFWLEKSPSHTKKALLLAHWYPKSHFIAIVRNIVDVVSSSLHHGSDPPTAWNRISKISRVVAGWVYYNKVIDQLYRQYPTRTYILKYQNFRDSKKKVLSSLCKFLDIKYRPNMLDFSYDKNTSFKEEKSRNKSMKDREKVFVQWLAALLYKVPFRLYQSLDDVRYYYRGHPNLPNWFFRLSDPETKMNEAYRG